MEQLNNLPLIDWELALRLAGNKHDLAKEILDLFVKMLPDDLSAINQLHQTQNHSELLRRVHKLHGAICYCGVPRLKNIIARIEIELKNNIVLNLPFLLDQFNSEANLVLEHYSTHTE